ncbi:hypothetical protein J4231_01520, partial [Candidatus Woesearchaeota archaeon]|nr:hypothetical protein [Candidatus Woesearchaeota archaeon]
LIIIGVLLFKILGFTGDVIRPPCGGGKINIDFSVFGSKTGDAVAYEPLHTARITLEREGANCMYEGKTSKDGKLSFPVMVEGSYKMTIKMKDINRGKTLCDVYKENIDISEDGFYSVVLTNCNQHAFNI